MFLLHLENQEEPHLVHDGGYVEASIQVFLNCSLLQSLVGLHTSVFVIADVSVRYVCIFSQHYRIHMDTGKRNHCLGIM